MGVLQYNEPMMWILINDGLTNQTNVKEQYFLFKQNISKIMILKK
jgi:hypothetical protein